MPTYILIDLAKLIKKLCDVLQLLHHVMYFLSAI